MAAPVLITGASGFVGRHLMRALDKAGRAYRPVGREHGELHGATDWSALLAGCGSVIHLAARPGGGERAQAEVLALTLNLARQAVSAGVRRFIFLSSVKVLGESSRPGHPFTEADLPAPTTSYARAKLAAETGLAAIEGIALTSVRAPLIYGPGSGGSLLTLMHALDRGWPLPLASVDNRRSMLGVDNLCDFLILALDHPQACGTFGLADGELSTPVLLRRLAGHLGRKERLFPVPQSLLDLGLRLVGRSDISVRLLSCLQLDPALAVARLGWTPRVSVDEGLAGMTRAFRERA